jgi:hypothetical protein
MKISKSILLAAILFCMTTVAIAAFINGGQDATKGVVNIRVDDAGEFKWLGATAFFGNREVDLDPQYISSSTGTVWFTFPIPYEGNTKPNQMVFRLWNAKIEGRPRNGKSFSMEGPGPSITIPIY